MIRTYKPDEELMLSSDWRKRIDIDRDCARCLSVRDRFVKYALACWLAMGERCFAVQPEGRVCANGWRNQPADLACPSCHGTGYLRAPAPLWWALSPGPSTLPAWQSAAILHASALRVVAGMKPLDEVWMKMPDNGSTYKEAEYQWNRAHPRHEGFRVYGSTQAMFLAVPIRALLDGDALRAEVPDE